MTTQTKQVKQWAQAHMVECPNCHEGDIEGIDLGDHPDYLVYDCDNCGRRWNTDEVEEWGRPVCRKCGEVLQANDGLAVNDEPNLGGCCI